MHHLGVNEVLYITCFITMCEAYLGIPTFPTFFPHFFYFCIHKHDMMDYSCGGVVIYQRNGPPMPRMQFRDSFKKWQRNFFYVCNIGEGRDLVGLPAFIDAPPDATNWSVNSNSPDIMPLVGRLVVLWSSMGLMAEDLIAAFISRRMQPLQESPHRICDMSGPKDPCRLSTVELPLHKVAARANRISGFQLEEETWIFGMEPYHRANRAPLMFAQQNTPYGPHPKHFVADL
ncbi:hypothetical protein D1007_09743 [Hordeum vulgare]|nr:hypothetical protein D1007_09743 [Hordeum vulgare]